MIDFKAWFSDYQLTTMVLMPQGTGLSQNFTPSTMIWIKIAPHTHHGQHAVNGTLSATVRGRPFKRQLRNEGCTFMKEAVAFTWDLVHHKKVPWLPIPPSTAYCLPSSLSSPPLFPFFCVMPQNDTARGPEFPPASRTVETYIGVSVFFS